MSKDKGAFIVGAGIVLSAALARALSESGYKIALAARNIEKLKSLAEEVHAKCFAIDASNASQLEKLFSDLNAAGSHTPPSFNNKNLLSRLVKVKYDKKSYPHCLFMTVTLCQDPVSYV